MLQDYLYHGLSVMRKDSQYTLLKCKLSTFEQNPFNPTRLLWSSQDILWSALPGVIKDIS